MPKIIKVILFHLLLIFFILIGNILISNPSINDAIKKIIYLVHLIIIFILLGFSREFFISPHEIIAISNRLRFYLSVFLFYLILFSIGLMIFLFQEKHVASSYFTFLLIAWFFSLFDYSIPSYKRFVRLLSSGELGGQTKN